MYTAEQYSGVYVFIKKLLIYPLPTFEYFVYPIKLVISARSKNILKRV